MPGKVWCLSPHTRAPASPEYILKLAMVGTGSALRAAVICWYLSNEGISILENAAHLGLPVPDKLRTVLEQLHDRKDKDDTTDQGDGE